MSVIQISGRASRTLARAGTRLTVRQFCSSTTTEPQVTSERRGDSGIARRNAERMREYLDKYGSHREAIIAPHAHTNDQGPVVEKPATRLKKHIPPVTGKIPPIETIGKTLEDLHGAFDVEILDVREKAPFADWLIVCSGRTERHVRVIADGIKDDMRQCGILVDGDVVGIAGGASSDWKAVDVGNVVVHVMTEDTRQWYDLEGLWKPDRLNRDSETDNSES